MLIATVEKGGEEFTWNCAKCGKEHNGNAIKVTYKEGNVNTSFFLCKRCTDVFADVLKQVVAR